MVLGKASKKKPKSFGPVRKRGGGGGGGKTPFSLTKFVFFLKKKNKNVEDRWERGGGGGKTPMSVTKIVFFLKKRKRRRMF